MTQKHSRLKRKKEKEKLNIEKVTPLSTSFPLQHHPVSSELGGWLPDFSLVTCGRGGWFPDFPLFTCGRGG